MVIPSGWLLRAEDRSEWMSGKVLRGGRLVPLRAAGIRADGYSDRVGPKLSGKSPQDALTALLLGQP